ncbi:MAG: TetR family transcriptional regulator [Cohnella sp.]|nr:TetR family transcriptional regulator [Cohnella sp.]
MSKIAKKAGVSASTIYVYFENKEDMLNKLYLSIKKKMSLNENRSYGFCSKRKNKRAIP